jgi:hypothetical protein
MSTFVTGQAEAEIDLYGDFPDPVFAFGFLVLC